MARGKNGLQAARHRAEAAHEHIDRLTDDVVRWKMLAKHNEAEAAAAPGLRRRVSELTRQVEEMTSPALEVERQTRREAEQRHRDQLEQIARIIRSAMDRTGTDDTMANFVTTEMVTLQNLLGDTFRNSEHTSRDVRRWKMKKGHLDEALKNADSAFLREHGVMMAGNMVRFRNEEPKPEEAKRVDEDEVYCVVCDQPIEPGTEVMEMEPVGVAHSDCGDGDDG